MQDSELKKLLQETCPILPGQEARAWMALKEKLSSEKSPSWSWLYVPSWRGMTVALSLFALLVVVLGQFYAGLTNNSLATANSQSPGIYATAFYSRTADAQVVWLNGMEPASDKPTYLDPTNPIGSRSETESPVGDPNSL